MADSVTGVGGRPLTSIKSDQPKGDARLRPDDNEPAVKVERPDTDRVELSTAAQAELDKAGFDARK